MHADSLLRSVRRVDEQAAALLSLRTLSGPEPPRRIDVAMDALVDLAELLRAAAPFPPRVEGDGGGDQTAYRSDGGRRGSVPGEETAGRVPWWGDDLVRHVLEVGYGRDVVTTGALEPGIVDRITASDRLKTVDGRVFVPLSATVPYARNWRPVIETLLERVDVAIENFGRIERRLRTDGTGIRAGLVPGCEGVMEMLETLALVVRRADADARYVRDRTDHRQGELLETVERATTQLGPRPGSRSRAQSNPRSDDNA